MKTEAAKTAAVRWLRIAAMAYAAFIMIFSLDVFGTGESLLSEIGGFIVHSLPSIIIFAIVAVFWKKPALAGIGLIVLALIMTVWFGAYKAFPTFLMVTIIPVAIGAGLAAFGREAGKVI